MKRFCPSIVVLLGFLATVAYISSSNSSLLEELNLVRPAEAETARSPAPKPEPLPKFRHYHDIITGNIITGEIVPAPEREPVPKFIYGSNIITGEIVPSSSTSFRDSQINITPSSLE